MSNNHSLIRAAAKAVGAEMTDFPESTTPNHWIIQRLGCKGLGKIFDKWDPENNDADAMRIAAHLGMRVDFDYQGYRGPGKAAAVWLKGDTSVFAPYWDATHADIMKNARSVILRAAAHVGEQMP